MAGVGWVGPIFCCWRAPRSSKCYVRRFGMHAPGDNFFPHFALPLNVGGRPYVRPTVAYTELSSGTHVTRPMSSFSAADNVRRKKKRYLMETFYLFLSYFGQ